jgi:hypothetical protein
MVQRIEGKDSTSSASSTQGPQRQDERAAADRAAKFRDMLAAQKQKDAEGADAAKAARTAKPGGQGEAEGVGGRQGAGVATDPAAPGRSGPGSPAELAAAAKELQTALEEIGVKSTRSGKSGGDDASSGDPLGAQLASVANLAPAWARPEGPARVEAPGRLMPAELEGMEKMHRLLIGQGPAGAEARLSITDGPLAGAQIHLRTGPGGIQAAVSTTNESSRQTLSTAMDEVARRMRDKGHRLNVRKAPPPTRPEHTDWNNHPSDDKG